MRVLLVMALRNILRNKKRSLITLSAIALGLAALVFLRSFIFGAQSQMIRNITETLTGDIQIVPAALENIYNTNGAIEDPVSVRKTILQDRRIAAFTERIVRGGMIAGETRSLPTFIVGLDPVGEAKIGSNRGLVQGRMLKEGDTQAAVIGEKMRKALHLNLGDPLIVMAQDYFSSAAAEKWTLIGTFETGNDQIDNGTVMILKESAQRFLSFEHRISKFVLKIDPRYKPEQVSAELRSQVTGEDLKVVTWEKLIPMIAQMIQFQNGMIFVVMIIILTVVAAGILNTLMMSIVERIREFGLMMALGAKPSRVMLLVVCESFLMTVAGGTVGIVLGIAITLLTGRIGIDLKSLVSALTNLLIGPRVYPRLDLTTVFAFFLAVLVASLMVSLYPAWRAGKLSPIEAMRRRG